MTRTMSNKPSVNVNTILTSLVLIGIVGLFTSINGLKADVAVLKSNQLNESEIIHSFAQNEKDFDKRIRDLEFRKHGDGL